jgi:transcriptional regulator with XRE-family HTH domain
MEFGEGWVSFVPERGILIGQREKLGMSQEEVAEKAGIKPEQYKMYESHESRFSSSSMRIVNAVLTALELDPTAFANGEYSFAPANGDANDAGYQHMLEIAHRKKHG